VAGSLTPAEAHRIAREEGVSAPLYRTVRAAAVLFMKRKRKALRLPATGSWDAVVHMR
jgi:hypothetical protein